MTGRARRWVAPGYALALALAVTAPLLSPGYLLLRDAVSTPRSYLSDAALGLGESAPRAVPQDFLVAVVSAVVDGGVLVKALLVTGLFLAGWGAARLAAGVLPEAGPPGQLVAATVAIWNPYVAERLLQGHWSLLVGYGCLPWVAGTVVALRAGDSGSALGGMAALAFWTAVAGLTPTGLLLAAVVALVCAAGPGDGLARRWCAAGALGAAAVAASPWLVAAALGTGLQASPASGVSAFAARAEPGLGTLGSLAGLGGIWNAEALPDSRTTLFALAGTLTLLTVVAVGVPQLMRRSQARPLLVLAAAAIVLPAAMASGPGLALMRAVIEAAPGLGVLRDGQKWVALAMPGYALAGAGAVLTLRRWVQPGVTAAICAVALIVMLPDLAWGSWGKVSSVQYPAGWQAVAGIVNADPGPVAVLPPDSMRQFRWAGDAPVLDPLPRWVRGEVLATGDLTISGQTVYGEGTRAREVQRALLSGAAPGELVGLGVRWVVVESGSTGGTGAAEQTLAGLPLAYDDAEIRLYHVGGSGPAASRAERAAVLLAHLMWLGLLGAGAVGMAAARWRGDSHV